MKNKIILGTVNFGLDYGIANKKGQLTKRGVKSILDFAHKNGVRVLDTSLLYGTSERVIGNYHKSGKNKFKIISKFPDPEKPLEFYIKESRRNLNKRKLYGFLFHRFDSYRKNRSLLKELQDLKKKGLVSKIGFSLYYPEELELIFKNKDKFDLLQVPYNLLDQRFGPYFETLSKKGVEIHTRSVFLQGLLLSKPENLKTKFKKISGLLKKLQKYSLESGIPVESLCLGFVANNKNVSKLVIGVDEVNQLKKNLQYTKYLKTIDSLQSEFDQFKIKDEKIIIPSNW